MKHLTPQHMVGFNDALLKEAGRVGNFFRAAKDFASKNKTVMRGVGMAGRELKGKYGRQMMAGAGVGAVGGAAVADPDQPGGRLSGALKGALLGGGVAGGRVLATREGRQAAKKGVGNFYQRQKYSLTGKGLGKTDEAKLKRAREIGLVSKPVNTQGMTPKQVRQAGAKGAVEQEALQKGYMSAPGVVHGMLTNPGDVLKSGWKRSGTMGKAFAGLGAYETGKGLIEKPKEGGPGRLEKGLRGVGSAVGWMVAPTTLVGGQIIGMGGGALGSKIGKLGDKATQMVRRPGQVTPQGGY